MSRKVKGRADLRDVRLGGLLPAWLHLALSVADCKRLTALASGRGDIPSPHTYSVTYRSERGSGLAHRKSASRNLKFPLMLMFSRMPVFAYILYVVLRRDSTNLSFRCKYGYLIRIVKSHVFLHSVFFQWSRCRSIALWSRSNLWQVALLMARLTASWGLPPLPVLKITSIIPPILWWRWIRMRSYRVPRCSVNLWELHWSRLATRLQKL